MRVTQPDTRTAQQKQDDERAAAEPALLPPPLSPGIQGRPVEDFLREEHQAPLAVLGIVENGLVRPLDPQVKLTERSRVIIVASHSGC